MSIVYSVVVVDYTIAIMIPLKPCSDIGIFTNKPYSTHWCTIEGLQAVVAAADSKIYSSVTEAFWNQKGIIKKKQKTESIGSKNG